ncbi:CpsD/CapB family tyrosine-protein kinase [Roseobacter sp. N2S]|uniref:CpsD/CapB family tyrosine-protein kinase n=1 Tax=Roseobacter sp. N2S TaxID=2663844 RepID=UPI002856DE12|nr:CpsD/CapB family tyrosine-protein kinase [Roseobacter sp. N2S]MDR6267662.1 capsular exopolysaccharide synthesis family protein [Roseobacter sp. N2S]
MEKLQAAIEHAKNKRATQPTTGSAGVTKEALPQSSEITQNAWAALQPFAPKGKILRKNRILTAENNDDTTYYDMLRTRILQRIRREGWKRIMITSPDSGCGKSTISSNLAMSFARNSEIRTILIDLDLRRPSIGRFFGHQSLESFHDVLRGQETFEDHAVRVGQNLAIATNRTAARHSSELLQSEGAIKMLDDIEQKYQPDIMLFDMPPMLGSDDTHAFMQQVDCAILITAAEDTALENIDSCEKDLAEHLPVLGVVLNKCRYMEQEIGYAY